MTANRPPGENHSDSEDTGGTASDDSDSAPAEDVEADSSPFDTEHRQTGRPTGVEPATEIDWRGWTLVAVVIISFLVVPALVLFIPAASGYISSLGFSARQAYLALPMVPAILLGATAVWASLRTER